MPVWRDITKELRESGDLQVVGIVQEQHPDRTQLYADWQGLDFPILWDPFNTLGVEYVLIASFVDAHGIVRATGLSPKDPERLRALIDAKNSPPDGDWKAAEPWVTPSMGRTRIAHRPGSLEAVKASMSRVLWPVPETSPSKAALDELVGQTEKRLAASDVQAADHFRAGVARRLRFDSSHGSQGDGQAAIDHWVQALTRNPNQYIWRRRIQQWGPRLDKPYPFYDWVNQAFSDLKERGQPHAPLQTVLSGSEVAGKRGPARAETSEQVEPDPGGKLERDGGVLVGIECASAPHSDIVNPDASPSEKSARVHLSIKPLAGSQWTPDTDAAQVWIQAPEGWRMDNKLQTFPQPTEASTKKRLALDFEIHAPKEARKGTLTGYVVYSICKPDGVCLFRRQDFSLDVRVARPKLKDAKPGSR
ncbi:MAG: hypothetical protein P1V35_16705 [Planctomycetota bacterium]|nr:hypothetical protein [Planctomycetota bacterium]